MTILLWILLFIGLLSWATKVVPMLWGIGRIPRLPDSPNGAELPSLSVVIPACNEAENVEKSLRSLLAQDYPKLQVVAVDDRSEDETGDILDRLASEFPERVRVLHIRRLPEEWLGKNYALSEGAKASRGEWLLFSDADVVFEPGVLELAVEYAIAANTDHLTLIPDLEHQGFWEGAIEASFTFFMLKWIRFWKMSDPDCEDAMGIGAFNLVKRESYHKFGGHEPIRLCIDDDVKIVECLKDAGMRVAIAGAVKLLKVRWQKGLRGIVQGMEKNAFASFLFRLDFVCVLILAMLVVDVLPYIVLFYSPHPLARAICALEALLAVVVYYRLGTFFATPRWAGLFHPLMILVLIYAIVNSTAITLKNRGIRWRGTFYELEKLKNFQPPLSRKILWF